MQKTITFLEWNPKRDFYTDNLVCRVKFSVVDTVLIGTPRESESIHFITITITDILLGRWRVPGGLDFGITEGMIKVALQSLEDYLAEQIKQAPLPDGELEPITLDTENSPETCPYKLANILYPAKVSFVIETEDQGSQGLTTSQVNIGGNVSGSTIIIGNHNEVRGHNEDVKKAFNLDGIKLAQSGYVNYPGDKYYNVSTEEYTFAFINESGQKITKCFILLDEHRMKENYKRSSWKVAGKDVYDKPLRWNKEDVPSDGKIEIDQNDKASFILIEKIRYPVLNVSENRNEYITDYQVPFWREGSNGLSNMCDHHLFLGMRGITESGEYFVIRYALKFRIKRLIPEILKLERIETIG